MKLYLRKMNCIGIIILCSFTYFSFGQAPKKLKVLFLGNSYTAVNNLPQLVHDIAQANGDTLIFDSNCPGGHTFYDHFNNSTSVSKISAEHWDNVVLQAQSQEPSFSPTQVATQTLPYALKLDSLVALNYSCTITMFFETWGRKNGDASNCGTYPPVCTYLGMQDRLRQSYKLFSDTCKAVMAPVGESWRKSIAQTPSLELYQADQSHPSLEGSYLSACVFYETIFGKSVLSNTFNPGISTVTLSFLQQIAHSVVNDSSFIWNIGKYNPCGPSLLETNFESYNSNFVVFPNPSSNILNISIRSDDYNEQYTYSIIDMFGSTQKSGLFNGSNISISDLPPGVYFIELIGTRTLGFVKFLKK